MLLAVPAFGDDQRLAVVALGLGVLTALVLDGPEVDQILGDERVAVAVHLPRHRQDAAADLVGGREVAGVELRVEQLAQRGREVGARRLPGRVQPRRLLECRDRLLVRPRSSSTRPSAVVARATAGSSAGR